MTEITYKELEGYVKTQKDPFPPVFLIHGEEYLAEKALKNLLEALLPQSDSDLNYEPLDGEAENVFPAIEKLNTFSLFSEKKVVALLDSRIFYAKQDSSVMFEKAKAAFGEDYQKSAKIFLNYLALLNLDLDDLSVEDRSSVLSRKLDENEKKWLDKILAYCHSEGLSVPSSGTHAERLNNAIEKGFPKENHLIITTELVDKRRLLFKSIKEKGMVVDCSVPKGSRKADLDHQGAVLNETLKNILNKTGKSLDGDAYSALIDKTGFDLRTFTGNLEKLVDFVGSRDRITADDVDNLLNRTKIDPIFELTNAVSDKNSELSLFYVKSLLSTGLHPLQIVAALTNQLRKLLVCRSLINDLSSAGWNPKLSFNEFKRKIVPLIVDSDTALKEHLIQWERDTTPEEEKPTSKKKKGRGKSKKAVSSDLLIAQNPNNAYPVYQLLRKSVSFTITELISAMEYTGKADRLLKTSPLDPTIILEKLIADIC